LNKKNWKIGFKWVKAHAGIFGNEIADRPAKEATQDKYVTYRRITKSVVKRIRGKKAQENGKVKGRKQRKGAITKEFFPSVERRMAVNLN
jgi:hypothetical protein